MMQPAVPLGELSAHLDDVLSTASVPDYPGALNGVQVEHVGPVTRCAVAVDASLRTIQSAADLGANLLVVHHGLFWGGVKPITGRMYRRLQLLLRHDIAVYSSHLPLDAHATLGNNHLLARALGLEPSHGFAHFQGVAVGVMGESDIETSSLASAVQTVTRAGGGMLVVAGTVAGAMEGRRTRRWALCTGAGASSETLRDAAAAGVDTLIVGEGPHHTAVEAEELGIAVLYAGHYATETLGVQALGAELERSFGLPWSFVAAPTGL